MFKMIFVTCYIVIKLTYNATKAFEFDTGLFSKVTNMSLLLFLARTISVNSVGCPT